MVTPYQERELWEEGCPGVYDLFVLDDTCLYYLW